MTGIPAKDELRALTAECPIGQDMRRHHVMSTATANEA